MGTILVTIGIEPTHVHFDLDTEGAKLLLELPDASQDLLNALPVRHRGLQIDLIGPQSTGRCG